MRNDNINPFEVTGSNKKKSYYVKSKSSSKSFSMDIFSGQPADTRGQIILVNPKFLTFWLIFLFAGIFILTARTAYLQISQGQYFSEVADGNRIRVIDIKAPRGVIYDRHQNLLVENVPSLSLAVIPVDLPQEQEVLLQVAQEIAKVTAGNPDEIFTILDSLSPYSFQPVSLKDNLTQDEAIMTEILNSKYPGVILRSSSLRNYLITENQQSLSHLLGYIGKINQQDLRTYLDQGYLIDDYVGKAGVELQYETLLKGVNGRQQMEVDATGNTKEVLAFQSPVSGKNLILTIDAELQAIAEESLKRVLSSHNKQRGAVVAMDPNSGEILAMVSLPTFDNNAFSRGLSGEEFAALVNDPDRPLFSRAISGSYPSGSTFKMIVAAAALEEGVVTPSTGFNSVGGLAVGSWFFPDWKAGGHGWTNLAKALSESVNTFFYMIGGGYNDFIGLGVDRIAQYAKMFGVSEKLGIDLPNEASGFFPSKDWKESVKNERWYVGDTYNLSIGQGDILVTPLQVAAWTAVFANGGTLYKPYVVKEILNSDNTVISEVDPQVLNQDFIAAENVAAVNRGLRQAVTSGSAVRLSTLPIAAAAKTGTAQWSSKDAPHGWLTAYAPYDQPQIVVTVLVEEGEGGTTTATPVAYDILNWWANHR